MKRKPHARPIQPSERMSLAEILVSIAMLVIVFIVAFILIPVLAS